MKKAQLKRSRPRVHFIWTHHPIWASTAKSLGLSVSTDMPDDVLQLLTLYPQPFARRAAA
jgi:hypothetical protein